jgi:hypothetical protein
MRGSFYRHCESVMEKAMRTLMLASVAALAIAAVPLGLSAQDQNPEPAPHVAQPAPAVPGSVEPAPDTANEANADVPPLPTTEEVIPADEPGEPDTLVTTHHGNLAPPPATALNKTYPVCTRSLQDSCRNPGEGEGQDTALGG